MPRMTPATGLGNVHDETHTAALDLESVASEAAHRITVAIELLESEDDDNGGFWRTVMREQLELVRDQLRVTYDAVSVEARARRATATNGGA